MVPDDGQVHGSAGAVIFGMILRSVVEYELAVAKRQGLATEGGVEESGDGQDGVAELFGVEATEVGFPEEPVKRVLLLVPGILWMGRGHLVGIGIKDDAVDVLHGPAVCHEFVGEPVQKFGMGRSTAQFPEVFRTIDQSLAKVPAPDAVDDDSGGEGISRVRQPVGQFQPPTLFGRENGGD